MAKTVTMKPNTGGIFPPAVLNEAIVNRIDRGLKSLELDYGLKGQLKLTMALEPNAQKQMRWTFTLYRLDEVIVTTTNASIGGINKFLGACASTVAKLYGAAETKSRKTA